MIKYSEGTRKQSLRPAPRSEPHIGAENQGKRNLAKIWQYKLDYILMAIVSSGTGADEENSWIVISPEHEYVLLNAMGLVARNIYFRAVLRADHSPQARRFPPPHIIST